MSGLASTMSSSFSALHALGWTLAFAASCFAGGYAEIEEEYVENRGRFERVACPEDRRDLERLGGRLDSEVRPEELGREARADFECLRHVVRKSLEEYAFSGGDAAPASVIPTGGLLDRMARAAGGGRVPDYAAALSYVENLASAIAMAPDGWEEASKAQFKAARKRAAEFRDVARSELDLLAAHLEGARARDWAAAGKRLQDALDAYVEAVDRLLPSLADPTSAEAAAGRRRRMDFVLRHAYLADFDSAELLRRGARFFLETEGELRDQAAKIDPASTWERIAREIEEDHPAREGLVEFAKSATMAALEFVEARGLATLGAESRRIEVRDGDPEGPLPYAHYAPAHDGSPAAFVVVPCGPGWTEARAEEHLRGNNRCWLRVVALHEAVPGHHLQFSAAGGTRSRIRRHMRAPTHMEGWALYCEEMMGRHGFYDPRTRLTQLRMKLWRAARVLISLGMDHLGLGRSGAAAFLRDRVLAMASHAGKEAAQYEERPHYFVAYAVGFWQIEDLRERMRAAWGPGFSDRRFHDEFLSVGPVPVPLAGRIMASR